MALNIAQMTQQASPTDRGQYALYQLFNKTWNNLSTQSLTNAGLVITATAGKLVPKIGASDWYGTCNGTLVKVAAATDMPALSGSIANSAFNVFVFYINSAGTVSSVIGTAGTTLATIKWPELPDKQAMIGFIIINPTGSGSFVGNTTALDDVTVVPNTVYVSPEGAFDPVKTI